ncbi:GNAT family N-acetyltransferase [Kitasatospora sp. NPDC028055]|uniref:GNAT family N-acetyltransferase n=1 Tax=Kitasatospora sp. NPDC028055 TaxID=3155653 RepID=UPI0033EBE1C9
MSDEVIKHVTLRRSALLSVALQLVGLVAQVGQQLHPVRGEVLTQEFEFAHEVADGRQPLVVGAPEAQALVGREVVAAQFGGRIVQTPVLETFTDPDAAARVLDEITPLYERVFAEPPYLEGPRDLAGFLEGYEAFRTMPGFRLVLARSGGALVGFAFGVLLQPDSRWWNGLDVDESFTREDGSRTFVIREIAVAPEQRRRGLGRELHAAVLEGARVERVTHAVRPEAEAAMRMYEAIGYRDLGAKPPAWEGAPVYRYMVR